MHFGVLTGPCRADGRMRTAVVLVSGGLDSATTLALARKGGFDCYALSVDYGQRHRVELQSAARIVERLGAREHKVVKLDLTVFGGSALTDASMAVPTTASTGIPSTYVPARNTIMLSLALAWAEVTGSRDIFIGANAVDYSGYPDCRPEYLQAYEAMANLATKAAVEGARLRIHAPLLTSEQGRNHSTRHRSWRRLFADGFLLPAHADRSGLRSLRFLSHSASGFRRCRYCRYHGLRLNGVP